MHPLTHRRTAPLIVIILFLIGFGTVSTTHAPAALACNAQTDPTCVSVSAASPGVLAGGGRSAQVPGGSGAGVPAGSGGEDASEPSGAAGPVDPCPSCGCPELEARFGDAPAEVLHAVLVANECAEGPMAKEEVAAGGAAPPAPSPAVLAVRAASSFELPVPVLGRFPAGMMRDGRPYTVVGTHLWFWTDAAAWKPLTATARARGNWATVTATPTRLTFTPGDGGAPVSCQGPGLVFDPRSAEYTYPGSWAPVAEPGGCDYVYQRASGNYPNEEVTAMLAVTWRLTWTGSGNTSGTLTQRTVSTTGRFVVAEVQSVVSG